MPFDRTNQFEKQASVVNTRILVAAPGGKCFTVITVSTGQIELFARCVSRKVGIFSEPDHGNGLKGDVAQGIHVGKGDGAFLTALQDRNADGTL